jgi:hypothetical protein
VTGEQREAAGELDQPDDDQDPAERIEVVEYVPSVVDEDPRVAQGADAVEDVDDARDQQQSAGKDDATRTSHVCPLYFAARFVAARPRASDPNSLRSASPSHAEYLAKRARLGGRTRTPRASRYTATDRGSTTAWRSGRSRQLDPPHDVRWRRVVAGGAFPASRADPGNLVPHHQPGPPSP